MVLIIKEKVLKVIKKVLIFELDRHSYLNNQEKDWKWGCLLTRVLHF